VALGTARGLLSLRSFWPVRVFDPQLTTQDMLRLEEGPDRRFSLTLLDPGTGDMIWTYPASIIPISKPTSAKKSILLQFDDELVVLKFFSL